MTKKIISLIAVLLANLLIGSKADACNGWEPSRDGAGRLPTARVVSVSNLRDEGVWLDNYQGAFLVLDSVSFNAVALQRMRDASGGGYTEFGYEFRRGGNTEDYLDDPERYDHWDGIWAKYNNKCLLGIGYIFGSVCVASWNYGETHTAFYTDIPGGDVKGSEEADLWFDHTRGRTAGALELANILRGYDILSLSYDGCSLAEECDEEYEMGSDANGLVADIKYHIGIFFKVDSNDGTSETPWRTTLFLEHPEDVLEKYGLSIFGIKLGITTSEAFDTCPLASGVWSIEPDAPLINSLDSDLDGISNNLDPDDDNDGVPDTSDGLPYNASELVDTDHDGIGDNADTDDDNDGYTDSSELSCGSDPLNASSRPPDNDGDKIPDCIDADDDNDGVVDTSDALPFDSAEWLDTDGDGIGNNADADDDGDGYPDQLELSMGTNPLDAQSRPEDNDGDGLPDVMDPDDDNDGVDDIYDVFPFDASESVDTDGDGIGDNADMDDDNDGFSDAVEISLGTDPRNPFSRPYDNDGDGVPDDIDSDDDNDGIPDSLDPFPFDPGEARDTDHDGIGDNVDLDDDNDLYPDTVESALGSDPLNPLSKPPDYDGDLIPDAYDTDDDNDGVPDSTDAFPHDASEWADTDGDGIGNNADLDNDNDGVPDTLDAFPLDPSESVDTDHDGIGNNADPDDDNDSMPDTYEIAHGLNPLVNDAGGDKDGDGFSNIEEYFDGTDPNNAASFPPFCGFSTEKACTSDSDCTVGGCSGQACKGVSESIVTTCDVHPCQDSHKYGLNCICYDHKCRWTEPFCGFSTLKVCSNSSECTVGGCSGQACKGVSESIVTTCDVRDCQSAASYRLSCGCFANQCQWR